MDTMAFFRTRYDDLHGRFIDDLVSGLTDYQLRHRPDRRVNTITWLLYHVTRAEDIGVNRFLADRREVLDQQQWLERLGLHRRDIGTGMDDVEVDELSDKVDFAALRAYWDAVGLRTLEVMQSLRPEALDAVITEQFAQRVGIEEGAVGANGRWLVEYWTGKTRAWFLGQLALVHTYGHIYEARVVKGLWGLHGR
ncbi:MAG: DinB family protein [Armatimonadota bacterium]